VQRDYGLSYDQIQRRADVGETIDGVLYKFAVRVSNGQKFITYDSFARWVQAYDADTLASALKEIDKRTAAWADNSAPGFIQTNGPAYLTASLDRLVAAGQLAHEVIKC